MRGEVKNVRAVRGAIVARAAAGAAAAAVDKFGLPTHWTFLSESEQECRDREATARNLLREVLEVAAQHLGCQQVSEEWSRFARTKGLSPNSKGGRPTGPAAPDIDKSLLEEWDLRASQLAPDARRSLLKAIAEDVANRKTPWARETRDQLAKTSGTSAEAIEQRIRRLLREREQSIAAERLKQRVLQKGLPPTLLE